MGCELMAMDLKILIFLSFPEAIFNLMIMLLVAEEKGRLKFSKSNVIRYFLALILMLAASYFLRPLATNFAVNALYHCFAYTLILMFIYRINFFKGLYSTAIFYLLYATIELSYTPYIFTYITKGTENFFSNIPYAFVLCLPLRVMQFAVVVFLWKYNIVFTMTKIDKKFQIKFSICAIVLVSAELYFAYILSNYFDTYTLLHKISYSIILFIMVIGFNSLLLSFLYSAAKRLIIGGFNKYKEVETEAMFAFKEVRTLLENGDNESAILLINELLGEKPKGYKTE